MKIHGYAALAPRSPLAPFSYEKPPLSAHEILIKITHSGLCRTDLYMIDDDWKRSTYPLLPGHEIVGAVVERGALADRQIGERVGASWVRSSCLVCPECQKGDTNVCQKKLGIYNQGRFGGFADHVVADSRFAFPIPDALDSAHAAPLLCAGATVYAPFIHHKIQPGSSVGIIGIGGLGHLALQYAKAFLCDVSAISSSPTKEKEAMSFGARRFYSLDAPLPALQFDFLLCTSDAPLDWNHILSSLKPNGILCLVSRPPNGLAIDPAYLVSTQRTICGSNNAGRQMMNEMLAFSAHHSIRPQIETLPLSRINEAIEKVRINAARYRIVLAL